MVNLKDADSFLEAITQYLHNFREHFLTLSHLEPDDTSHTFSHTESYDPVLSHSFKYLIDGVPIFSINFFPYHQAKSITVQIYFEHHNMTYDISEPIHLRLPRILQFIKSSINLEITKYNNSYIQKLSYIESKLNKLP